MDYQQQPPSGQPPYGSQQPGYPPQPPQGYPTQAPQGYQQPPPGYDPQQQYSVPPPPPGYVPPQQPYAPPPAYPLPSGALKIKTGPNPAAVVGMVFGILAMLLVFVHWYYNPYMQVLTNPIYYYYYDGFGLSQWFSLLPLVASIVGLVCSVIGNKVAAERNSGKGMAITGMILSIIAMVFAFIQLIACGLCISLLGTEEFIDAIW